MATITTKEDYMKDKRTPCKYGFKCYQKNPTHHEKFKHPPKRIPKPTPIEEKGIEQTVKKIKLDTDVPTKDVPISSVQPTSEIEEDNLNIESCSSSDTSPNRECTASPENVGILSSEEQLCSSGVPDSASFIEAKFLVKMPPDFYSFWELCQDMQPNAPLQAFKEVNLLLVGPFDVLAGKFNNVTNKKPEDYLIHWRYFYDPPEFQTVLKGDDSTGYHIGYFRDCPKKLPVFVACNRAKKDCEIKPIGGNIFGAVNTYLEEFKKTCDPFKKLSVSKLQSKLKTTADKLKLDLVQKTEAMKMRRFITKTFHKAGISVPFDKRTQVGYRKLMVTEAELKKHLTRISSATGDNRQTYMSLLTPIITATDIANDEGDFGTGLELGIDIFSSGVESLHSTVLHFLTVAYDLLNREEFGKIAEAHLKNRKKGTDLSIL